MKYQFLIKALVFPLFFFCFTAYSQEDSKWNGMGIEVTPMFGKVIKHSKKFILPVPQLSTACDFNFVWQTYGKKDWHKKRNYPVVGLGFTYTNYGIDSIYGRCFGIHTNIQLMLLQRKQFEWTFRIGDGISYITKRYQNTPPYDTLNTAIGSHINDFGIFLTDFRYKFNSNFDFQIGAHFTHISNGDYRSPNLGINMYGAHFSVRYFPVSKNPSRIIKEDYKEYKNRWLTQIRLGIAYTEGRTYGNPELPTYAISIYESKMWKKKNKFYGGVNYAYKESTYAFLKRYAVDFGKEKQNSWDGAFYIGNEFLVGKLGIICEAGIYYKQTFLKFDPYYEKIGGNFYLLKKDKGVIKELFTSLRLLTHGIVAEYAEFGIGTGF